MDFKSYVARIIWEADNDSQEFPPDSYHVWSIEGAGSPVGSLSSLGSAISHDKAEEEEGAAFSYDRLSHWGDKFEALSEMYERPALALTYREALSYSQSQRSHSQDNLPHPF